MNTKHKLMAAAAALGCALGAQAQEEETLNLREKLSLRGWEVEASYVFDATWNVSGGLDTGNGFRGDLSIGVEVDTETAGWWNNGTFGLTLQAEHGNGVSTEFSGDWQLLSGLDADDFAQVSQFSYRHDFLDGKLWLKGGKLDANEDFATTEYTGGFSTGSAALPPTIPMPTSPDQDLGLVLGFEPNEHFSLLAGVFQGNPDGSRSVGQALHSLRGPMVIIEPQLHYEIKGLPGTLRLGYWWNGEDYARLGQIEEEEEGFDALAARALFRSVAATGFGINYANALASFAAQEAATRITARILNEDDGMKDHAQGIYGTWNQLLYKENRDDADDAQGLGVFLQGAWTDGDTQEVDRYFGGGLEWTGAIPGRDEDVIGLGVFHTYFAKAAGYEEDGETIAELYYRAQLRPWLALKPTVQYVVHPGGSSVDNALAFGFGGEISF